jgi:guanylate kinase
MLVIISGPSGVGKDTIINALRERDHEREYHYVVTCTTRARRPGEIDGVSYHFLTRETFAAWRAAGEFLEANEVHGNWYGTPIDEVGEALVRGQHAILKIDVKGAEAVRDRVPDAFRIFIVPPSLESLYSRLVARNTETAQQLQRRHDDAAAELAQASRYDKVIINADGQVDQTAADIEAVITEEQALRVNRRVGL